MPAAVETHNGQAAFVAGRNTPPWHRLGEVVAGTMTKDEVLRRARLAGWDVQLEPVTYNGEHVEGLYYTTRRNPFTSEREAIAVVGTRYEVVQVEDAFEVAEGITNLGGQWDTAGSLNGGRRVFGTMVLPHEFSLDPEGINDRNVLFVGVATSFDGSMSVTFFVTPTRVVCQNTLTAALTNNERVYRVRHTRTAQERMAEVRQALRVAHAYMDDLEREANELYRQHVTDQQFDRIVKTYFDIPEPVISGVNKDGTPRVKNQAAITRKSNKRDTVNDLWRTAGTLEGIRNTGWGAVQALYEYEDYFAERRGDNKQANQVLDALSIDSNDTDKVRALEVVRDLVGV